MRIVVSAILAVYFNAQHCSIPAQYSHVFAYVHMRTHAHASIFHLMKEKHVLNLRGHQKSSRLFGALFEVSGEEVGGQAYTDLEVGHVLALHGTCLDVQLSLQGCVYQLGVPARCPIIHSYPEGW